MTRAFRRGFTLIELMVAVCVMAILYSSVPDMITQLQAPRLARATSDAAMLAAALWGPTPNYQGFIGDVGLATNTDPTSIQMSSCVGSGGTETLATDLVFPSQSFWTKQNVTGSQLVGALGVTMGWNGPYAGFNVNGLSVDPWGTCWAVNHCGQVWSAGPDGKWGTSDDILSPATGPMVRGTNACVNAPAATAMQGIITLTVRDADGTYITDNATDVQNLKVVIWQPASYSAGTSSRGLPLRYSVTGLPSGGGTTASQGYNIGSSTTSFVPGLGNNYLQFTVPPGRHAVEVYGVTNTVTAETPNATGCDGISAAVYPPTSGTLLPYYGSCQQLYGHAIANVAPGAVAALEIRLRESTASSGNGNPNGN